MCLAVIGVVACVGTASAGTGEVKGQIQMPEICSPSISPAVVYLEPAKRESVSKDATSRAGSSLAEVVLVNQRNLAFSPRVQVLPLGGRIRFGNQDSETHNVHVVSRGFTFNQSMAPGQTQDFVPDHAGVVQLACDIHLHMRGFVVVSPTAWAAVCNREGRFRLRDVPAGRYVLHVWHEMGDPATREIEVGSGDTAEISLAVTASAAQIAPGAVAQPRPWSEVLDRISVTLAASVDAARQPGGLNKARRLADDAYWAELEASDFETAILKYQGFSRAGSIERQFRAIRSAIGEVADKRSSPDRAQELIHTLLLDLVGAAQELNAKGITDSSKVTVAVGVGTAPAEFASSTSEQDPALLLQGLKRGLRRVAEESDRAGGDRAAAELTTVYMTDFEPIERYLMGREPQAIRPLEIRFSNLRGEVASGLKGPELEARLLALQAEVESRLGKLESRGAVGFGSAFTASLITIVREGVEVILVVAMLLALVSRAAQGGTGVTSDEEARVRERSRRQGIRSVWSGVGLAIVLSLGTAALLNRIVASAQGRTRELFEGGVMLAASFVLFYVSYWLVSQVEARRWMEYLKAHAKRGLELSGRGTLALTAFLAVYREGAETALMYQALLGSEGRTSEGAFGIGVGLLVGLVVLAAVAFVIRVTSVRLPIRAFFTVSGLFLFAMAIVFAGDAVFALQNAGLLKTTALRWLGSGIPWAGLYPNVQVASVQGLMLLGAIAAWLMLRADAPSSGPGQAARAGV